MDDKEVSFVPVWRIPRLDPGYIYAVQASGRLKIGKSKNRDSRIRDARTWLPDMTIVGVKPFWNIRELERQLHEGLAQWWYEGEWFDLLDDPYLEEFLSDFCTFSDHEDERDRNSINFLYFMHDMQEFAMEREHRGLGLRAFQRDISMTKRKK
jgi:hypothetical protein